MRKLSEMRKIQNFRPSQEQIASYCAGTCLIMRKCCIAATSATPVQLLWHSSSLARVKSRHGSMEAMPRGQNWHRHQCIIVTWITNYWLIDSRLTDTDMVSASISNQYCLIIDCLLRSLNYYNLVGSGCGLCCRIRLPLLIEQADLG